MKIFNNFDTSLKEKEYNEAVDNYGKSRIILIQRCVAYWIVKGYLYGFLFLMVAFLIAFLCYEAYYIHEILFFVSLVLSSLFLIVFIMYFIYTYLHYKMDFTVVTPDEIITYAQKGFLDSSYKSFPIGKIRSIKSSRTGLLGNIFGFGDLVFISDGSSEIAHPNGEKYGSGKMTLTYVSRPNELKKRIMDIANSGHHKAIER